MECHEKIKKLRIENGLSQKDLANKLGVSQNAVYNWENGKRSIRGDVLQQIADVFGVRRVDLLDDVAWDLSGIPDNIHYDPVKAIKQIFSGEDREGLQKEFEEYRETEEYDRMQILLLCFRNVTEEGQEKIIEYATDIADNPKYNRLGNKGD